MLHPVRMQHTADPELNILCSRDDNDVFLTEIFVHNF